MTNRRHLPTLVSLWFIALLLPGCVVGVPVTEPLSDPLKAKPDKRLHGKWVGEGKGYVEIDSPVVNGAPEGIMRAVFHDPDRADKPVWFLTTTIDKTGYATMYWDRSGPADFSAEDAFEKWSKGKHRCYIIVAYGLDGNKLTLSSTSALFRKGGKPGNLRGKRGFRLYATPVPAGGVQKVRPLCLSAV